MEEGNTLVNALLGAIVSIFAGSMIPFGPLVGGVTAGYLQGGDRSDGLRVGFYSGLIALIPAILIGFLVMMVFGAMFIGMDPLHAGFGFGVFGVVFLVFGFLFAVVYVVGLSTVGGWLGNYLKYDTDIDI